MLIFFNSQRCRCFAFRGVPMDCSASDLRILTFLTSFSRGLLWTVSKLLLRRGCYLRAEHFADEANAKIGGGVDIRTQPRSMAKLKKQARTWPLPASCFALPFALSVRSPILRPALSARSAPSCLDRAPTGQEPHRPHLRFARALPAASPQLTRG